MRYPSRKGAPNWSHEEWDLLFGEYPPTGAHPPREGIARIARQIGRSEDAVGWSWEDANNLIGGRKSTSSLRQQAYLRERGWLTDTPPGQKLQPDKPWSQGEVEATVADYLDMLRDEVEGRPYSKADHRARLRQRLNGRSDAAIAMKYQNISAVLRERGLRYIGGYKPLANYQQALAKEVDRQLDPGLPIGTANAPANGPPVTTLEATPDLASIRATYARYVEARNALLDELNLKRRSNRDPLAEFSEWLVAAIVGGTRAENPVQKGWDVRTADGERIQVKYLANPSDVWVNEHHMHVNDDMDSYALVLFEALMPEAVIILPARQLAAVGAALGKRHGGLDSNLQFTRRNYRAIHADPATFGKVGVRLYLAPDWSLASGTARPRRIRPAVSRRSDSVEAYRQEIRDGIPRWEHDFQIRGRRNSAVGA